MTLSQKLLLGFGALVAYLYITAGTASAATSGSPAIGGGGGTGGGLVPNAGDSLLVSTGQTGAAGQLFIRSSPGVQAGTTVGAGNIVAIAQHGDTLTATGSVQTASDGTVWWGVRNSSGVSGWSESNYLTNQSGS